MQGFLDVAIHVSFHLFHGLPGHRDRSANAIARADDGGANEGVEMDAPEIRGHPAVEAIIADVDVDDVPHRGWGFDEALNEASDGSLLDAEASFIVLGDQDFTGAIHVEFQEAPFHLLHGLEARVVFVLTSKSILETVDELVELVIRRAIPGFTAAHVQGGREFRSALFHGANGNNN